MKHLYTLFMLSSLVCASAFAGKFGGKVVDAAPMSGRAIIEGRECGYYVTADKKFLHIDCADELITASYQCGTPATANVIMTGYKSFEYTDKQGVKRTCFYKPLSTISKKTMVAK